MPGASKRRQQVARRAAAGAESADQSSRDPAPRAQQTPRRGPSTSGPAADSRPAGYDGGDSPHDRQSTASRGRQSAAPTPSHARAQSNVTSGQEQPPRSPMSPSGAAAGARIPPPSGPSRDPARDPVEPPSVKDLNRKLDLPYEAFKLDNLVSIVHSLPWIIESLPVLNPVRGVSFPPESSLSLAIHHSHSRAPRDYPHVLATSQITRKHHFIDCSVASPFT